MNRWMLTSLRDWISSVSKTLQAFFLGASGHVKIQRLQQVEVNEINNHYYYIVWKATVNFSIQILQIASCTRFSKDTVFYWPSLGNLCSYHIFSCPTRHVLLYFKLNNITLSVENKTPMEFGHTTVTTTTRLRNNSLLFFRINWLPFYIW